MLSVKKNIAVVGLGYVGLPVAVAFGKENDVIGFDINTQRIEELKNNIDCTNEVTTKDLKEANIKFTNNKKELTEADFIIVAVPTPIDEHNQPDLTPLIKASETVGSALQKGTIVVFESTVYPGATEEVCVPILEQESKLLYGQDFFVGYSPERINPGDTTHRFTTITKIVAGQNEKITDEMAEVYGSVIEAGVYKASSIKVAEAAKVIENTQRDVNIALMNELAIIFNQLNIDTSEVLKAAGTKWNFLNFKPGLVGGHCIGVDPYYLTYKAESIGYHPEVILSGRRINDNIAKFIALNIIKALIKQGITIHGAKVNVYGLTFKENCPDLRNTKVIQVIQELKEYGLDIYSHDPVADKLEAAKIYGIKLQDFESLPQADVAIFAVAHDLYLQQKQSYLNLIKDNGVICDVKAIIADDDVKVTQYFWRL
ncbi:nucleotide sugar dehydrogenase [Staphylococcus sp. 18_1_E_LY]|uniref:Nucleotide sugar dehydrogenase n=1 Tax=Staphylococcus lloydii TaxID=2781774 RepID=A0A7T1FAR4_9STAP|nr:nucleotide sugar dehydrogenase [Staphylococcus lloydii]MBF7026088.1 nucleotide sugar dehydrogenase [Staphylococcus lloydii]QPM76111.1 nucleotide sugar dehydrogenase [Staphylococcus lloydii]